MNAETAPARRRRRPLPDKRYVRPSDVRSIRAHLELGFRVLRTERDVFGPGQHALVLMLEEVS